MSAWVDHNGTLFPADEPVLRLDNRAFHFGDGLFESIRVVGGRACFLDAHWARLTTGAELLRITLPDGFDRQRFGEAIAAVVERSGISSGRARFTLYRGGGGYYRPEQDAGRYAIELNALPDPHHVLNPTGLQVDIWPEIRKPVNELSRHKTLNCQYYIMAALWARARGLDDCLLQNDRGNIIESSAGNLFIVSNGVLYTPSLTDGCIGGVMRAQVINLALANGVKVYECSLNPQNLLAADELFFTNAIQGIRWVGGYRTKRYAHKLSGMLTGLIVSSTLS
ncbi:MAG: aminotransferase class IV [Flavobacteriales bacterium]|jgi:branched-chain amino acid aminotransferase|nr:MAG: aminotransferase class IV [Flavobacteriales bacterium]